VDYLASAAKVKVKVKVKPINNNIFFIIPLYKRGIL
jgi:hypothetical protein